VAAAGVASAGDYDPLHAEPDNYIVPPFALTERSGRTVGRDDLLGKVWVASFRSPSSGPESSSPKSGSCPHIHRSSTRTP